MLLICTLNVHPAEETSPWKKDLMMLLSLSWQMLLSRVTSRSSHHRVVIGVGFQVARAADQFGLVLVVERMEESLVLLAEYLCWELRDVLVLHLNAIRDGVRNVAEEGSAGLGEVDQGEKR